MRPTATDGKVPIKPENRHRYPPPAAWEKIRGHILERAGFRCEQWIAPGPRSDGRRCNASHGTWIARGQEDPESWIQAPDPAYVRDGFAPAIRVVLTVAHLNHIPEDCRPENLRALCQLHHLRHDADHHRANAAATRAAKSRQLDLFGGKAKKK